jgi:hypothetical protein
MTVRPRQERGEGYMYFPSKGRLSKSNLIIKGWLNLSSIQDMLFKNFTSKYHFRFLYHQLQVYAQDPSKSIFEVKFEGGSKKLTISSQYSFHFFMDNAPNGDAWHYKLSEQSQEEFSDYTKVKPGKGVLCVKSKVGKKLIN